MKVAFDYYSEYAGDCGVRFVRNTPDNPTAFDVWDGFFDPIMTCLDDLCNRRVAIPYLPILREWNEFGPFRFRDGAATVFELDDLKEFIGALRQIDSSLLAEQCPSYCAKLSKVMDDLIPFLESAFQAGETVTLSEG